MKKEIKIDASRLQRLLKKINESPDRSYLDTGEDGAFSPSGNYDTETTLSKIANVGTELANITGDETGLGALSNCIQALQGLRDVFETELASSSDSAKFDAMQDELLNAGDLGDAKF